MHIEQITLRTGSAFKSIGLITVNASSNSLFGPHWIIENNASCVADVTVSAFKRCRELRWQRTLKRKSV